MKIKKTIFDNLRSNIISAGGDLEDQASGFITAKNVIANGGTHDDAMYYGLEDGLKLMQNKKRNAAVLQKLVRG